MQGEFALHRLRWTPAPPQMQDLLRRSIKQRPLSWFLWLPLGCHNHHFEGLGLEKWHGLHEYMCGIY